MLGIAILCAISGLFLGLAVGFILGHKEGSKKTVEHFEILVGCYCLEIFLAGMLWGVILSWWIERR